MVISSVFVLNLFCSLFSCSFNHEYPANTSPGFKTGLRRRSAILNANPLISTTGGLVEGYVMRTTEEREIYAFEGIPYGEPPIGSFRFKAAKRRRPWQGVLAAKSPGPHCAQVNSKMIPNIQGSEDCLYLNVYCPEIRMNRSELLPVVVYFHGGAFGLSSGSDAGPAYLLEYDIILVPINYRLGLLGFMSTGDKSSPGNYGLKDQGLALEWIHENIDRFGGNKSLVTLFGSSAGGASVHLHMLANRTRSFFSAGISASGTGFNPWALKTSAQTRHMNRKLAKRTNCHLGNTREFVNCLRKLNVYDLVRQQKFLYDWYVVPAVLFGPVVEYPSPEAFLSEHPKTIYRKNEAAKYPWIFTRVSDECDSFIMVLDSFRLMPQILRRWASVAPLILDYEDREPIARTPLITRNISIAYFGKEIPDLNDSRNIGKAWSDRYFNFPIHEAVKAHSKIAPTYFGVFGFKGFPSQAAYYRLSRAAWGVSHGEDEFYYFNKSSSFPGFKTTDSEYSIVKFLTNAVVTFAKTREPLTKDNNGHQIRVWKPVTDPNNVQTLSVNEKIEMTGEPRKDKFRLWDAMDLI